MKRAIEVRLDSVAHVGQVVDFDTYKPVWVDRECYVSMFVYGERGIKHWKENNTCANYDGPVILNKLWIDIDCDGDLDKAQKATQLIVSRLKEEYKCTDTQVIIFFSGGKGFHVGIDSKIFGGWMYESESVPFIAKLMVLDICMIDIDDREAQSKSPVDFKIYNSTRIFRSPLSLHSKSGLYKIPLSVHSLFNLSIEEIKLKAKNKDIDRVKYDTYTNVRLKKLFDSCKNRKQEYKSVSSPIVKSTGVRTSIFFMPEEGERNEIIFKQAFRLFVESKLKKEEVWDIMRLIVEAVNSKSSRPITKQEFDKTLLSADRAAANAKTKQYHSLSFEDMIGAAMDSLVATRVIPTGVHEFDSVLEGGFSRGSFYLFIGRGGTKKSIFAQNTALLNSTVHGNVGIFFNLEMSNTQFFRRGVKKLLKLELKNLAQQGNVDITKLRSTIYSQLESRLIVVNCASDFGFRPDSIESIIKEEEERRGVKISYAFIDSLGAMDMGNNETMALIKYSAQLKKVAKNTDTAIVAINHVNQAGEAHYRDASHFVRGGSKLIDNCDAYFTMSLVLDDANSNPMQKRFEYEQDKLWVRLTDKRESGANVDKVFQITQDLDLVPLMADPNTFEKFIQV